MANVELSDGLLAGEERPAAGAAELPADTSVKMMGDDQLTEAELAYFKSGGQEVTGLLNDTRYKDDVIARQAAEAGAPPTNPDIPVPASAAPLAPAAPVQASTTPAAPAAEVVVPEGEDVDFTKVVTDPDGRMRDDKGRFVPHAALHKERVRLAAERERSNGLAAENATLNQNYTKLSERVKVLQEIFEKNNEPVPAAAAPATPEPVAPPDPETDIFAYSRWQADQIKAANERIEALAKKMEESTGQVQAKMTEQSMVSAYKEDASRFAAEKPDFGKAYSHLIVQRHAALAMMGFADAEERNKIINSEERELVERAYTQGKRPAEFIYNYASTMGYRAAAPDPTQTTPAPVAAAPGSGGDTPAAPAGAVISEAEKLLNAQRAQAASATLSGTGAASGEGLTAEALANMSEAQFEQIAAQLGRKGMRAYMGGAV